MAQVLVLYPSGLPFNLDYYRDKHMALVSSKWGPHGFIGWEITEFSPDAPYQIAATLKFTSLEDFDAALKGKGGKPVMDDIVNYTGATPVFLKGGVVASSQ
ncbi:hypothetical protein BJX70DRAFT_401037 [Aspergillus crustosus]